MHQSRNAKNKQKIKPQQLNEKTGKDQNSQFSQMNQLKLKEARNESTLKHSDHSLKICKVTQKAAMEHSMQLYNANKTFESPAKTGKNTVNTGIKESVKIRIQIHYILRISRNDREKNSVAQSNFLIYYRKSKSEILVSHLNPPSKLFSLSPVVNFLNRNFPSSTPIMKQII